jgi:hypothetical protein
MEGCLRLLARQGSLLLTNEVGEIMQPTQFVWLLPGVGVKIRSQLCWNENRKVD